MEQTSNGRARQRSERSLPHVREAGGSRKTVLIALAANALIAVTKLAGGLLSGSAALLAEAAHSLADTANQAFLLASIKIAGRPPTEARPFGYGRQRYLWTFLAAILMLIAGAVFAVGYGVMELLKGEESSGGFAIAWVTLAIALVAEGISWIRAARQTRGEAREARRPFLRYARQSRDPNVKMVLFEDTAALAGIAIAAVGIGMHQLTGEAAWDAAASIVIGLGLIAVAIWVAHDMSALLTGAAALPEEREEIERVLEAHPGVDHVVELLTVVLGPGALLVAARIDLVDGQDAGEAEQLASELDDAVRAAVPDVTEVFLDPTPGR